MDSQARQDGHLRHYSRTMLLQKALTGTNTEKTLEQ